MVEQDRYCVDVLTQISAAQKALDAAAKIITGNYLERCVTDAVNGGDPLICDELMRVMHHPPRQVMLRPCPDQQTRLTSRCRGFRR